MTVAWFLRRTSLPQLAGSGQKTSTSHLSLCQQGGNCRDSLSEGRGVSGWIFDVQKWTHCINL